VPTRFAVARAVFANHDLRRAAAAFTLFSVSEWATWLAIIVYAYGRGGAAEAGIVACVLFVPSIVVAPAASVVGDRLPRARVLTASYLIQAVAFLGACIALTTGPVLLAYALATLAATCITLTRPAHASLLPELVADPDELAAANVASGTIEGLGALVGPLVAGVLVGLAGPQAVYLATGTAAATAALVVFPLARRAHPLPAVAVADAEPVVARRSAVWRVADELRVGLRMIRADRRLVAVFAVLGGAIGLLGALNVFYAVVAIDILRLDESAVGYLAAVAGVGSIVGAAGSAALVGRERIAWAMIVAAVLFGGAVGVVGLAGSPLPVGIALLFAGGGWAFVYVEARTLAQRLAGDDVLSRVFGVMEALMMATQAAGALLVPLLVVTLGPSTAIVASGLLLVAIAAFVTPTVLRADRLDPERIQRLRTLRAVPMFAPLAAPVLELLSAEATDVTAAPGETIVVQGEGGDRFFVIRSGTAEVTIDGRVVRRQGPGEWFGEIALVRDVPRTATVRAIEPMELLALGRDAFLEALTGQPRSRAVAAAITDRRLADGSEAATPG
jgi:MFS family permease